jgi:hypothetical protein
MFELVEFVLDWLRPPRDKRQKRYYRIGLALAVAVLGIRVLFFILGAQA